MKNTFIYLTLVTLLLSCAQKGENSTAKYKMAEMESLDDMAMASPVVQLAKQDATRNTATTGIRKLIKTGNVSFKTDDLEKTKARILEAVKANGAYVSKDEQSNSSYQITHTLSVRIPSKNFDKFLANVSEGVAKFDSKNIYIKDVTEEFLDVQARIKTKKELEKRYLELLKKADKVIDMLGVEREIGRLRTDIDTSEGRLKYLKSQVSFSTLNITYYKVTKSVAEGFGGKFVNAFEKGWENLLWFFIGIINLWAFLLFGFIGFFIVRKFIRKRRKK